MSAEIKSVQNQNEERTGFRSASIAQVDWKGTKREFEKLDVSIGNTEGLDLAIRKYSEVPEENLMMSVAVLVSFAVVGIAAIVAAIYASFVLAPVILVGGYLALAIPLECMASREREFREQTLKDLRACKEALATEGFGSFVVEHFGKVHFSVDQVLKVHQLFQQDQTIQTLRKKFEESKAKISAALGA